MYDLATPFFGSEVDIAKLYLAPALRENIAFHLYESGHMTFVDEQVVAQMHEDLRAFVARATNHTPVTFD